MTTAVATSPVAALSTFLDKFKPQLALALPKHMTADRMARLTLTAFSTTPALQECEPQSIALAMLTAGQMGLEPGVNGQCFLVPYSTQDKSTKKWVKRAQLIPGWKGLVDLVSRSGRAAVWTGAVFSGDFFEYALGDRPFVTHRPGLEDDPAKLLFVYAVGRVNGSDHPVIEVWSMAKIWRHRDRVIAKLPDWQQAKHYSHRDPEMYARKVPLLQVLKYMPTSTEVANAVAIADAAEMGRGATLEAMVDGSYVTTLDDDHDGGPTDAPPPPAAPAQPEVTRKSATVDRIDPASGEVTSGPAADAPPRKPPPPAPPQGSAADALPPANRKWLDKKIAANLWDAATVAGLLGRHGCASLDSLTPTQFDAVRAEIIANE